MESSEGKGRLTHPHGDSRFDGSTTPSRNAKIGDFDDHTLYVDLKERSKAPFVDVVEALR